ncbi:MAG: zinc metallopeptidase [Candidatus Latescibacteria bacterium]|nr:zinc metallopeptidase [Candidatus Latescibacterota bacterium]
MFPFFFDRTMILLIPAVLLGFYAQMRIRNTYARYSRFSSRNGWTGAQIARRMLDASGLRDVNIEQIRGKLSDHYDPKKRVLRLSEGVYASDSVAALGVAAHETGHALQHGQGYLPLRLRSHFVPVANFGSGLAWPLFFIGFFFSASGLSFLMDVGIVFFSAAVLFHVVTLPVEFNASQRALAMLGGQGYLTEEETMAAGKVLHAAAWTYVATATMAIMQLIRMVMLRGGGDD